jgi:hypothetical protein
MKDVNNKIKEKHWTSQEFRQTNTGGTWREFAGVGVDLA